MEPADIIQLLVTAFVAYRVLQTGYYGLTHPIMPLEIPLMKRVLLYQGNGRLVASIGNIVGAVLLIAGLAMLLTTDGEQSVLLLVSILLIIVSDVLGYFLTKPRPRFISEADIKQMEAQQRERRALEMRLLNAMKVAKEKDQGQTEEGL